MLPSGRFFEAPSVRLVWIVWSALWRPRVSPDRLVPDKRVALIAVVSASMPLRASTGITTKGTRSESITSSLRIGGACEVITLKWLGKASVLSREPLIMIIIRRWGKCRAAVIAIVHHRLRHHVGILLGAHIGWSWVENRRRGIRLRERLIFHMMRHRWEAWNQALRYRIHTSGRSMRYGLSALCAYRARGVA